MTLAELIQLQIQSDDHPDQSDRIEKIYSDATEPQRAAIDDLLIALCGWSLPTLLSQLSELEGNPDAQAALLQQANDSRMYKP